MTKGLFFGLLAFLVLSLSTRALDAQAPSFYRAPAAAYAAFARVAVGCFFPALFCHDPGRLFAAFALRPQAQDAGGGSGDGGSSDGGGTDGSSSDSSSAEDGGDAAAAAAADAADEATASAEAVDTEAVATTVENSPVSPLDAIQSQATTDPRGGSASSSFETGFPVAPAAAGGPVPPLAAGAAPPAGPVDITINAVIVSGASSPWHAVQRAPGVRNVVVNGGIIAWGKTPLPGEPPPSPQPDWLHVNPDPQLVNGSVIPPVVPNIIDIRWLNCPIEVIEKLDK
jgi:hypothetical protein